MDTTNATKVKPVVHFKNPDFVRVGYSAYVVAIDHPSPLVTPNNLVRTSKVLSIDTKGNFETENTKYVWEVTSE
jgi:hypothetical protein